LKVVELSKEEPQREMAKMKRPDDAKLGQIEKYRMEQSGLDITYKSKLDEHIKRVNMLKANLVKAYALIYSQYCSKTMQQRVEEDPEFEDKIRDDPIELLKALKVLMHDTARARYPFTSMTEALTRLLHIKQGEQEQLLDYVKRLKEARDVITSIVGKDILDKFVENTQEY
jgi:hypothetical protein